MPVKGDTIGMYGHNRHKIHVISIATEKHVGAQSKYIEIYFTVL